jgi:hypothetical protein
VDSFIPNGSAQITWARQIYSWVYQHHWETVGLEVCHAALKFLNFMIMDDNINATHIAFIPKKKKKKKEILVVLLILG